MIILISDPIFCVQWRNPSICSRIYRVLANFFRGGTGNGENESSCRMVLRPGKTFQGLYRQDPEGQRG